MKKSIGIDVSMRTLDVALYDGKTFRGRKSQDKLCYLLTIDGFAHHR